MRIVKAAARANGTRIHSGWTVNSLERIRLVVMGVFSRPTCGSNGFCLIKTTIAGTKLNVKNVEKRIAKAPNPPKICNGLKLVTVIDKSPTLVEIVVRLMGQIIAEKTLMTR